MSRKFADRKFYEKKGTFTGHDFWDREFFKAFGRFPSNMSEIRQFSNGLIHERAENLTFKEARAIINAPGIARRNKKDA